MNVPRGRSSPDGRQGTLVSRLAAVVFLLALVPGLAHGAPPPELRPKLDWKRLRQIELEIKPYVDLLERYGKGERTATVAEIATWPLPRLGAQLQPFMGLEKWVDTWDPSGRLVRAALMLHIDAAELVRASGRTPWLQRDAVRSLAREFAEDPRLGSFIERSFVALACDAQADIRWLDALDWADRGLRLFDKNVELRLVVASVREVLASRTAAPVPGAVFDGPAETTRTQPWASNETSRNHLERARRTLQQAVKLQPQRGDVRLRLGRVEWRLRRFSDAHKTFEALLAAVPREQAYLAHLFYGQLLEDEGRLEAAAREYSLAVLVDPQCQAARLALSQVGLQLGETAEARSDVELALAPAGRRKAQDAFWQYHWGPSAAGPALLAKVRREVWP